MDVSLEKIQIFNLYRLVTAQGSNGIACQIDFFGFQKEFFRVDVYPESW